MIRFFIPWIALAFLAGCILGYSITPTLTELALLILISAIGTLIAHSNKKAVLIGVCIIVLLLGIVRVIYTERNQESRFVHDHTGTLTIKGVITGDIETKNKNSRYPVTVTHIQGTMLTKERAILVYEPYPTICVPGEHITFSAKLQEPEDFVTKTGRIFKYKEYLRQFNIHAIAYIQESNCKGEGSQYYIFSHLRAFFTEAMHQILPIQEASLLGGLLLGLRGALSEELLEAFRVTGLIHIIVLSGYNVTIVAEAVRRMFLWTSNRFSFFISLVTIILFVILAGAQTAAVRAGAMAAIALIARATYREYDGVRALLLVAALMVLYNPDQILFSISFHLSFLATLGLLIFTPTIERHLHFITDKFQIRSITSVTLATQVFLLPYLAYVIGEVSIIGILANILVLPLVPIAMGTGALVTLVAIVFIPLGIVLTPLAYIPLHGIIELANILAKTPFATVRLPEIPILVMGLLILALTWFGYKQLHKERK